MMNDKDLQAVRELRPYEPTDLAVARTRHRLFARPQRPARMLSRPLSVAGSAVAVLAVVGLVVMAQVIGTPPRESSVGAQPPDPASVGAQPPDPAPASTTPTPAPTLWDMSITPAQVPDDAVLYVRSGHPEGDATELWVDVDGAIVVMYGLTTDPAPFSVDDETIAAERAALATDGPSLIHPTPAYLATLPTDPAALLALLTDQLARGGDGRVRPDLLLKNTIQLVLLVEPLLSSQQRATFLDAVALAPGGEVDRSPRTIAGHDVYLVQQRNGTTIAGFLVDCDTGRILGAFAGLGQLTDTNYSLATYAVVPAPGDRP